MDKSKIQLLSDKEFNRPENQNRDNVIIGYGKVESPNKHTDTDMQEFAEFCSNGGWVYFPQNSKCWDSYFSQEGTKTTAQLLQDWKIWKEEHK